MKKKLTVLVLSALLLLTAAGCSATQQSSGSSVSSSSASSSETSAASDTETSSASDSSDTQKSAASDKESSSASSASSAASDSSKAEASSKTGEESTQELSFDENGNPIIDIGDIDSWEIEESGDDTLPDDDDEITSDMTDQEIPDTESVSFTYQMLYLSGKNITSSTPLPSAYLITSVKELNQFISQNQTLYSLDEQYSANDTQQKNSFVNYSKNFTDAYFNASDLVVIVSQYSKAADCDLGEPTVKDDSIVFDIWTDHPSSSADTGYICFAVSLNKGDATNKTVTATINEDALTTEEQ